MHSVEREVLGDLIAAVRTLARQTLALHLQLGAVRTLLARKGTVTSAELAATMNELGAMAAMTEALAADAPDPDALFDDLLARLQRLG